MRNRLVISALAVGALFGCQSVTSQEAVERTFEFARAYLPADATVDGKAVRYRVAQISGQAMVAVETADSYQQFAGSWLDAVNDRIKLGTRWPVVVFLHGCAGYGDYSAPVAKDYAALGAIVVLPNSFARPGRKRMCFGELAFRERMRHAEAREALRRLEGVSWVDQERMVLAGQSEGGNAVASYAGDEFAGLIATGISCRENGGSVSAPRKVPVLAIKGDLDRFYPGGETCALGGRGGGSRSLLLRGQGHLALVAEEAKAAIAKFLRECCRISPTP